MVYALNNKYEQKSCRVVLDTGSTANFISKKLATTLRLPMKRCSIPVGALDNLTTIAKNVVSLTIRSRFTNFSRTFDFLIIPQISDLVPSEAIFREGITIPPNLRLADPEFHKPAPVDLLLAAGPTLSLFCIGQINSSQQGKDLFLQKTQFGWVVGGSVRSPLKQLSAKCYLSELRSEIERFWQIEESPTKAHFSKEELECEEHFTRNTTRDTTGRYIVALPFRKNPETLGESQAGALKRLYSLERKLAHNAELREQYTAVIEEYLHLGHMSLAQEHEQNIGFFLPHHAVVKETSMTTKVRVVFDGSAKTSSGVSLNDTLMVGPTIQADIFSHVIRFRLHKFVLTGDIEKMYRQFLVRKEDRKYQKILWRHNGTIKTFQLNTVTFGLGPAPFLAIRALHQLADDEKETFPKASKILKRDLYVDDLLTGAETIHEGIAMRDNIIQLLHKGGLNIRQWASNDPQLLEGIPETNINQKLQLDDNQTLKTLGVFWNSRDDAITYTAKPISVSGTVSKRVILSEIAKIFDPMGLLGPIILYAKSLMQKLWQLQLNWDESVPSHIHTAWTNFCTQLDLVNHLSFNRNVLIANSQNIQIHGFCDASEIGYGACIYIRSTDDRGNIQCQLLCAKSRVAPLKTVSLPRLELCSAQLLAKLFSSVRETIAREIHSTTFWTDSTIALCWIRTSPHTLKTFVANRVAEIQDKTNFNDWRHVRSNDNPADALSRGQLPKEFIDNNLWKIGPGWLTNHESSWPTTPIYSHQEIPETKKIVCLTAKGVDPSILSRFSTFVKLKRVIAYCLRFKRHNKYKGPLHIKELADAEKTIIKMTQTNTFAEELHDLTEGSRVNKKSKLNSLDPFIDKDGLLRVGGRLKQSNIPYTQQHPLVLPRSHHITELILKEHHVRNHHAGIQTTLYATRLRFWPIDGRNQVRKVVRQCVRCSRENPVAVNYIMGNLPSVRTQKARPFYHVGIDYCGPFFIKEKKYRNKNKIKVYVAVFVCLVVKAVHLEVVEDMTTEAFLGALRRFIARRGRPQSIHSDNGTNFIGANNELKEIYNFLQSQGNQTKIADFLSDKGIEWKFIPPLTPHFGGMWESTVKSFKHHFKRVIGVGLFTFIEMYTFVIEIEAILNSRPLTPISTDPNDILVLTPGHCLIGDPLTSIPEVDYSSTPSNRLSTWQHIHKVRRDFWTRWYKEYLNELNIRHKWTSGEHGIREGTIVVLRDDNLPPMQWRLGRVIKTHPGSNGIIRTVTVKTANNEFLRSVKRLAPLPVDVQNNEYGQ